jgi:hypothetical protein
MPPPRGSTGSKFDFKTMLKSSIERRRLIPAITAYLSDPDFDDIHMVIEGWNRSKRRHDGWWHPSGQATWDERALFLYLTQPEKVISEDIPSAGVKAITAGKFWHLFEQEILCRMGMLVEHDNPPGVHRAERPLSSAAHRVRGHTDGKLIETPRWPVPELLEIKSINEFQIDKIVDEDILREKKPGYWGQTQDYLWMEFGPGEGAMRYLIVHPSYPFPEVEFVVTPDARYQKRRMRLYARTWEAVQAHLAEDPEDQLPDICTGCVPGKGLTKTCALRISCPIGDSRA